jgi:hypothetical protein
VAQRADLAGPIRRHFKDKYVADAVRRGERRFKVRAGDVVKELGLHGRVPAVCSALTRKKILEENRLRIVERTGPQSGQSSSVTVTYEFLPGAPQLGHKKYDALIALRGIGKEVFRSLGGGEAFIRRERKAWGE